MKTDGGLNNFIAGNVHAPITPSGPSGEFAEFLRAAFGPPKRNAMMHKRDDDGLWYEYKYDGETWHKLGLVGDATDESA